MAVRRMKSAKVRDHLGEIMENVYFKGDDYVVEKGNRPVAAIISINEYRILQKQRDEDFAIIDELWEKNKATPAGQIELDVREALNEIRSDKAHKGRSSSGKGRRD